MCPSSAREGELSLGPVCSSPPRERDHRAWLSRMRCGASRRRPIHRISLRLATGATMFAVTLRMGNKAARATTAGQNLRCQLVVEANWITANNSTGNVATDVLDSTSRYTTAG